jgi:hypothetical protein
VKLINLNRYLTAVLTVSALLAITLSCSGYRGAGKSVYSERERNQEGAAGIADYEKTGGKRRSSRYYNRKSESDDRGREIKASQRMIVYFARFTLMVENVEGSVRAVEGIAKKFEGFIESSASSDSYRYAKVILRVPVASFNDALKDVEGLGNVSSKSVSATDVTMEFNDTKLRMESARKVRERMYQLLKRTKKVSERIKILREIERLTSFIESLEAKLKLLKNRASFSTIEIIFKAVVKQIVSRYIPSPFPWISGLNVKRRSIFSKGKLDYIKPEGFFFQSSSFYDKKSNVYLFSSPGEKAEIRAGVVDNYPPADFRFWKEAFAIDVENRKYSLIEKSELSGREKFMQYAVKVNSESVYVVAFAVSEKKIAVVEARFSTLEEYKNQRNKLNDFIKSVRFK